MDSYKFFDKDAMFTLGEGDPEKVYDDNEKHKSNIHLGQLKLLLSEMQLLVYHIDPARVNQVIYIGAANGHHLYVLSKLFSQFEYHLYDISDNWDPRLKGLANIKINNRYFTQKDIESWKKSGKNIILISDIRNLVVGGDDKEKCEKMIQDDMELQKTWVEQLEPVVALLKCRFPFCEQHNIEKFRGCKYNYLDGIIYRQIFPGYNSAETRLLVRGIAYRDWDFKIYEEQVFYHNSVVRPTFKFFNPISNDEKPICKERGLCNDYDCTAFTVIVMDYLKKTNVPVNHKNIMKTLLFILDNTYLKKKIDLNVERELSV